MADSTYLSILEAVQTTVRLLSLTDIDSDNVVIAKLPLARRGVVPALPGLIIAPFGMKTADAAGGTNASDDISYPVLIATLSKSDHDAAVNLDRDLKWGEDILAAFLHQRLPAVATVLTCEIEPRDAFDPNAWFAGYDAGAMVLRFISRE